MALLGSLILKPDEIDTVSYLIAGPDAFYAPAHQAIYTALRAVYEERRTGDLVLIIERLKDDSSLAAVGGADYLERLAVGTPSGVNAVHYARIVRNKHRLRKVIDAAASIDHECKNAGDSADVDKVIAACEERMFLACGTRGVDNIVPMSELIASEAERIEAVKNGDEKANHAVPSHWPGMDALMTGGCKPQEFIVVAGRPGMGKTSFGLDWCFSASRAGVPVLFVSLEMSARSLAQRAIAMLGPVNLPNVLLGTLSEDGMRRVYELRESPEAESVYVFDRADCNMAQVRAIARRMVRRKGIGMVVIDYLQLLAGGIPGVKRYEEVTLISRSLKMMSKSLQIPVVALAQLNRENEGRKSNKGQKTNVPRISDLRDSGAIEQDADAVILLHREGYYHPDKSDPWHQEDGADENAVEIIVAKNRNGGTGIVHTQWKGENVRFMAGVSS